MYPEFISRLQEYYGPYPTDTKVSGYLLSYLKKDIDERKLEKLFRYVTYSHGHRFGPPGISDIEKAIQAAIKLDKGGDVHSVQESGFKERDIGPAEDYEEGQRLLREAGGLKGLMDAAKERGEAVRETNLGIPGNREREER